MKNWSHDVPKGEKIYFTNVLNELKNIEHPKILEIGTYAGVSIMKMLEIVTNAYCVCIDNWGLSNDELESCKNHADNKYLTMNQIRDTFFSNTKNKKSQIRLIEKDSANAMAQLNNENELFDFIYVDGSHRADDTLMDMCMAWSLLKKGGIIGIDDYLYIPINNNGGRPLHAVDYFMRKLKGHYTLITKNYRVFLRKNKLPYL